MHVFVLHPLAAQRHSGALSGIACYTEPVPDQYGIPDNLFGHVPEEFYALIGRVVMMASYLEDCLLDLLQAMDDAPQITHADKFGNDLVKLARQRVTVLRDDAASEQFGTQVKALVEEVDAALKRRNEIVHSLWADPRLNGASGWRNVTSKLRKEEHDPRHLDQDGSFRSGAGRSSHGGAIGSLQGCGAHSAGVPRRP